MVPALPELPRRVWPYRVTAFVLILGTALARLAYLLVDCPLDLAPDEAHYWHWSQRLDWSYYSKGPLVALLIRASCWLFGGASELLIGSQMAAVRLPAILCGALLLTSVYVLTVQVLRRDHWALLFLALALTLPLLSAGSLIMTIDAPYTCCWGWALVFAYRAVFREDAWPWIAAGLCVAVGILAKYTMVLFVPMFALFLLATPTVRGHLRGRGFWVFVVVAALGALPILYWNIQNDWITLRHAQGHAGMQGAKATTFFWSGPLVYLATQCGLLLVYWFLAWAIAMWVHHPGKERRPEMRFLWFMSVPMFVFFALFSFKNGGGEPNWPITAYLSGLILAGQWLMEQLSSPNPVVRRTTRIMVPAMAIIGLVLTAVVHHPRLVQPVLARLADAPTAEKPTPMRRFDPTCRLRGWRTLAAQVDQVRDRLRAEGIEPVLAAAGWNVPGEISFYCKGQPEVFCVGAGLGDRYSQYDLWRPNPVAAPAPFLGKTFILIGTRDRAVADVFDEVEPTTEFYYVENGHPIAGWTITVCRGFRGFPKDGKQRRF